MYIICLFPFILLIAPVIGALLGQIFDNKEISRDSTHFIEKYSEAIGRVVAFIVLILTLFVGPWHLRDYSPRRWEILGIFIGVVIDVPLFLWLLVNASAQ